MDYNYDKLRGRIREICNTQALFAEKIGMSRSTLNQKLNNCIHFKQDEIEKSVIVLKLNKDDIPSYFFAQKV